MTPSRREGDGANPRPARSVTLADIARAAGTSASTASRALSGTGYVSDDARSRLQAAAERLGYVPNASARTLKQKTSRIVGVIVTDLGNPFYALLATGIEQTLREASYQVVLISDNSDRRQELAGIRAFLAMRAAGVVMTPVDEVAAHQLARHGVPLVEVDRQLARDPCDAVVVDNEQGARAATDHLLDAGHRRIALLVAATDWTSDTGRLAGFRAAHEARRVELDESLILPIAFHAPDAEARIGALLDVERPTAIFAANNLLAEHAWRVIRSRGLHLPQDVSLVGFDDVPWTEMVEPPITVVSQPTLEMGRRASRLLLRRIADPDCPPAVERLRPSLVVRGSVAEPASVRERAGSRRP